MSSRKRAKIEKGEDVERIPLKWIPLAELNKMSKTKAKAVYRRQYNESLVYVMDHLAGALTQTFEFPWILGLRTVKEVQWGLLLARESYVDRRAKPAIQKYISDKKHDCCTNSYCWCRTFITFIFGPRNYTPPLRVTKIPKSHTDMLLHVVDKIMIRRLALLLLLCARKWEATCPFYTGDGVNVPALFVPLDIFKFILRLAGVVGPVVLLDDNGDFLPWCIPRPTE